jgi:hypothetical protein
MRITPGSELNFSRRIVLDKANIKEDGFENEMRPVVA